MTKRIVPLVVALVAALTITACGEQVPSDQKQNLKKETQFQGQVGAKKQAVVGYPDVSNFVESANLRKRYEELDDVKIGYVYLLDHGLVFASYTVRGKVSSLNSQFTNPEQIVKTDYGDGWGTETVPQAEPDGSYGSNPDGIFFWTSDGTYVEWGGNYLYSKQRLSLAQPAQAVITKQAK